MRNEKLLSLFLTSDETFAYDYNLKMIAGKKSVLFIILLTFKVRDLKVWRDGIFIAHFYHKNWKSKYFVAQHDFSDHQNSPQIRTNLLHLLFSLSCFSPLIETELEKRFSFSLLSLTFWHVSICLIRVNT